MNEPLFDIVSIKKYFPFKGSILKAVDDVSFSIFPGEILGLVGESGSGKSTLGKCLMHLYPLSGGSIFFKGKSLQNFSKTELKNFRKNVQMIFQDPYSSLNPRMTAEDIIKEPLVIHEGYRKSSEMKQKVHELLSLVGLDSSHANCFPHEFSGGQKQRIGIARALALHPEFIVCDEPIAALDVSIQAQIVNLLKDLQRDLGLTYLFISHDLAMIKYLCTRVAVMYLGKIVEMGSSISLYKTPLHPYTQALLSAINIPDPKEEKNRSKIVLPGDIPSASQRPKGCVFSSRCSKVMPLCREIAPQMQEITPGHFVSCHLYQETKLSSHKLQILGKEQS